MPSPRQRDLKHSLAATLYALMTRGIGRRLVITDRFTHTDLGRIATGEARYAIRNYGGRAEMVLRLRLDRASNRREAEMLEIALEIVRIYNDPNPVRAPTLHPEHRTYSNRFKKPDAA